MLTGTKQRICTCGADQRIVHAETHPPRCSTTTAPVSSPSLLYVVCRSSEKCRRRPVGNPVAGSLACAWLKSNVRFQSWTKPPGTTGDVGSNVRFTEPVGTQPNRG